MRKRTSVWLLMAVVLYASQVWSDTQATNLFTSSTLPERQGKDG